jgi:hypothetical protein
MKRKNSFGLNLSLAAALAALFLVGISLTGCENYTGTTTPPTEYHNPNDNDTDDENDISILTEGQWIYDYKSNDHDYLSIFQFNPDFSVYEGKVIWGMGMNDIQFYSNDGEIIIVYQVGCAFDKFYSEQYHERLIKDSKLNFYTNSVIQTSEWGEVTYIIKGDTITLSNGIKLTRLVYSEPPALDIVYPSEVGDNSSLKVLGIRTFLSWEDEDNKFLLNGAPGASEPNAVIEVGIETRDPIYYDRIIIIARGVAEADGSFCLAMPPMSAGFCIATNMVRLYAKAYGKDRSSPTWYTAPFYANYMNNPDL